MLSESAREKLSRYQFVILERDMKIKKEPDKEHNIILLYAPTINMLACEFANQVIEDLGIVTTESAQADK